MDRARWECCCLHTCKSVQGGLRLAVGIPAGQVSTDLGEYLKSFWPRKKTHAWREHLLPARANLSPRLQRLLLQLTNRLFLLLLLCQAGSISAHFGEVQTGRRAFIRVCPVGCLLEVQLTMCPEVCCRLSQTPSIVVFQFVSEDYSILLSGIERWRN